MWYTSQQLADAVGVHLTTIYNWEKKNLIVPARKTISGRRYYSEEQVQACVAGDINNPVLRCKVSNGVSNKAGDKDGSR